MQDEQGGGEVRELPPYPARAAVPAVRLGALLGLDWSAGFEAWLGKSLGWLNLSCRPYRKGGRKSGTRQTSALLLPNGPPLLKEASQPVTLATQTLAQWT